MDEWNYEKKKRVFDIVKSLDLPDEGAVIDFGCGNGIFTDILKKVLTKWEVFGCDISEVAIANAKVRFPNCKFYISSDNEFREMKFDLLFTHHVLEHVYDINNIMSDISTLMKMESCIFHILPCGNENSFEHKICKLQKNGINPDMGGRYFFEDEGHIRRLNSKQLCNLHKPYNFSLLSEFYSNQYFGAIKWITQSSFKFIHTFVNPDFSIDKTSKNKLKLWRIYLLIICAIQKPATLYVQVNAIRNKKLKHYLFLSLDFLPYLISLPFKLIIDNKAQNEWRTKKTQRNGSEMYMIFKRN